MSSTEPTSNFSALEKRLAKDSLEEALKSIHFEVTKDIEKNKLSFSQEIQKTLDTFKENLKDHISKEVDDKISLHLEKNIQSIDEQVKASFNKMFAPVLEKTENDMKLLHIQGEQTLNSWADMTKQYTSLWTKPFVVSLCACVLTGVVISLVFSYFLTREQKVTIDRYARMLVSYQETILWYQEREKERESQPNTNNGNGKTNKSKKK